MEPSYPQLVILSYQELPSETQIEPYGAISLPQQSLPSFASYVTTTPPSANRNRRKCSDTSLDANKLCHFWNRKN